MKFLRPVIVTLAIPCLMTAALAQQQKPVDLRFGTVGVGSAWYNYGAGMADMIRPKLPARSNIDVLPKAGGIGNLKLIQSGEIELGISFSVSTGEACGGFGTVTQKHDKIRALMGGLDIYYFGTFVTRSSGVTSWDDIIAAKNRFHLLTTRPGGTGEQGVRQVISVMGSSKQEIEKKGGTIEAAERSDAAKAIKDGKAHGWAAYQFWRRRLASVSSSISPRDAEALRPTGPQ